MKPDERGLLPGEPDPREPSCAYPGCGLPEFVHGKSGHPFRPSVEPGGRCPDGMVNCNGYGYHVGTSARMACYEAHVLADSPSVEPGEALAEVARLRWAVNEAIELIDHDSAGDTTDARLVLAEVLLPTQASDSPEKP